MAGSNHISDITKLLRQYRNYIARADESEQRAVYWGEPQFADIEDHLEEQLLVIAGIGLLDEVEVDLSNLDQLYERALEVQKQVKQHRIDLKVADALASAKAIEPDTTAVRSQISKESDAKLSKVLREFVEREVATGNWSEKTRNKVESHFNELIKAVGDVNLSDFDENCVRRYLKHLDARTRIYTGQEIPISAETKNNHLNDCRRVLAFAKARYPSLKKIYLDEPDLKYRVGKKGRKTRMPYSRSELLQIFNHPIFTEGRFKYPYQYWGPLLALLTGSRANEICQLQVGDIREEGGIHFISHNLDTKDKRLKTDTPRDVPIHSKLIELGFLEYAKLMGKPKYRCLNRNSAPMLFRGLSEDTKRGGYQKNLSRWFNGTYDRESGTCAGFKHEAGIKIGDGQLKDFHSFRHTFATEAENAGIPSNIGYWLTGHSFDAAEEKMRSSAGGGYRHGVSLPVLYDNVCKIDFNEALNKVRPFFDLWSEKKLRTKRVTNV